MTMLIIQLIQIILRFAELLVGERCSKEILNPRQQICQAIAFTKRTLQHAYLFNYNILINNPR